MWNLNYDGLNLIFVDWSTDEAEKRKWFFDNIIIANERVCAEAKTHEIQTQLKFYLKFSMT